MSIVSLLPWGSFHHQPRHPHPLHPRPHFICCPHFRHLHCPRHCPWAAHLLSADAGAAAASCLPAEPLLPLVALYFIMADCYVIALAPAPSSHCCRSRGLTATGKCTTPSAAAVHGTATIPFVGIVQQNALLQYSSKCSKRNSFTHFPGTPVQGTYLTSNTVAGMGYSTILYEAGTQLKIPTRRGEMGLKLNNSAATGGHV